MSGIAINDAAFRARWHAGGAPTPSPTPAPITAVGADGWRAAMPSPADLALAPITVSRQGFDSTAAAATHVDTHRTTKRVRQPYPNQAVLTANDVALSDYVYSTDTIAGCTNNSTETSPKPVAAWSMCDRRVVGNSVTVSVVAFHRNGRAGKPVACLEFTASDGVGTVTHKVSAPTCSIDPLTGNAILEYVATLTLTSLNDNAAITVNAKAYPWIGDAGSVADSSPAGDQWAFTPRTFRRDTARFAAPYIVLVKSTGNDSTGAVDTSTSTSKAACLTIKGAIERARNVLGSGTGALDGVEIWLDAGTWDRPSSPSPTNTVNAAIVIKPMPGVSRASCILQFGSANSNFGAPHVLLKGLTIQRTGAFYLNHLLGTTTVEDCTWSWGGNLSQMGNSIAGSYYFINVEFAAGVSLSGLQESAGMRMAMLRGCTGGLANNNSQVQMITMLGNTLFGVAKHSAISRPEDGTVIAFNKLLGLGSTQAVTASVGTTLGGYALVQNVIEWTSATAARALNAASDGQNPSVNHFICWHNTFAGFDTYGRSNILYDETTGTLGDTTKRRLHRNQSLVGNIHVQINTKSDIYCGTQAIADAPNRTGNWAYNYGVGVRGEFSRYRDAAAGSAGFRQDYPGLDCSIGTINTGAGNDPLFTDPKHTTSGPSAGAGNGTYTLQGGSPALGLVTDSPLPFDLIGNARSGAAAAGAHA